jgi:putative membrane protein
MLRLLVKLMYTSICVITLAYLFKGIHVDDMTAALVAAAVLSLLNTFLKPILILFTLPLTLFTMGLFLVVINAIIILVADYLLDAFRVDSFWWALLFSILLSIATSMFEGMEKKNRSI